MNAVGQLLGIDDIVLDLDVADKRGVLEAIAGRLSRYHGLAYADVLQSLEAREKLGSTGLGHGVAIPHSRMPQCGAEAGVFIRTRVPVPFDAPDRKPVSMFLGLVVPKQAAEHHLQLLAAAASIFSDRTLRQNLATASDPAAVRALLAAWPETDRDPRR
jgi:PTS system nitrogen regulatory IIA component